MLRVYFRKDRRLLGKLSQCAYAYLKAFFQAILKKPQAVPGVIVTIQTFGDLANWHPHLCGQSQYRERSANQIPVPASARAVLVPRHCSCSHSATSALDPKASDQRRGHQGLNARGEPLVYRPNPGWIGCHRCDGRLRHFRPMRPVTQPNAVEVVLLSRLWDWSILVVATVESRNH